MITTLLLSFHCNDILLLHTGMMLIFVIKELSCIARSFQMTYSHVNSLHLSMTSFVALKAIAFEQAGF